MSTYTVKQVLGAGRPFGDKGYSAFDVQLDGDGVPNSAVAVFRKDPPAVGETLEGELSQGERGWKLTKGAQSRSAGPSGGGGRDDPTGRSIERQAAAKATAELLAQRNFNGTAELVSAYDQVYDTVIQKIRGGDA